MTIYRLRSVLILGLALACCQAFPVQTLQAGEIGWLEEFALGTDREAALKQLIPGTDDYYYFHCLHYQNNQQWQKVDELLKDWVTRHNWTPRALEIQNRQALLTYPQNAERSLQLLTKRLNLQFNHEREQLNPKSDLPTRLDPELLSRERLSREARDRFPNTLEGFENTALDWLAETELSPDLRRQLLARLERPDHPGLARLVVEDLNHPDSGGFGQFEIHRRLLLAQLDECLQLKPDLLNSQAFVDVYLVRLQPSNDVNWRQDLKALRAYLDRLWEFVSRLAPAHNSLKAHVLYHQLVLDRREGKYSEERFIEYLKLPRAAVYVEPRYIEPLERRQHLVNLEQDFSATTGLPAIGNDEPLVRSYLLHFFVEAKDYEKYALYLKDTWLKEVFAEAKIVAGVGDAQQWSALISPEQYQQLKERIDLDFAYTNKTEFAPEEPVSLGVYVKNVDTLIVKVFEINTRNFYRTHLKEVDTDVNLDGLVANSEKTYQYSEPSVRRVLRQFEFPELDHRGVYVIDFIGNGKASRALVRKGKLLSLRRTSVAGEVFTVFDESRQLVKNATLWLAGHQYKADEDGEIFVPFTQVPGPQPVVLSDGRFSSLQTVELHQEEYHLWCGFYVDREELLSRRTALLLVRPHLFLSQTPVTLKVLSDVRLTITATDLDGVVTTTQISDFKLYEDRESTHPFQVPSRLASIQFQLHAKVKNQSENKEKELSAHETFRLNEIDRTDKTEDLHFSQTAEGYFIDLLGKTGEAKAGRAVQLAIKLKDFKQPVPVTLQTNDQGRVALGPLPGVANVTATSPQGVSHTWEILEDQHNYSPELHGIATDELEVPYMGRQEKPKRSEISLLELRGDTFVADRFENVSIENGLLKISKLPPGDYSLKLKSSQTHIRLRLTEGVRRNDYVLGDYRGLQVRNARPLQLLPVEVTDDTLKIRLQNATDLARVHVFATRYQPAYYAFRQLYIRPPQVSAMLMPKPASTYVAGRDIGDEYRYILDRKFARKFPGNMLERPGLLLNPWAIRGTETGQKDAEAGDAYSAADLAMEGADLRMAYGGGAASDRRAQDFANLNFLAESSIVNANLAVDEQGRLEIKRADLGPHQELLILAIDPQNIASRRVALPSAKSDYLDLRLAKGLDPKQHYTQQKRISVLKAGEELVLPDVSSTRFEVYDNLERMYLLYAAINNEARLAEFRFLSTWPTLKPEQKQELYKKYASHELHLFLAKKDPEFFASAVKPYLANKKDKQFLDRWLLEEDLSGYLKSWEFEQLNTFERTLLGQRIEGQHDVIARLVREQVELLPPDPDRLNVLFETALKGNALSEQANFANMPRAVSRNLEPSSTEAAGAPSPLEDVEPQVNSAPNDPFKEPEIQMEKVDELIQLESEARGRSRAARRQLAAGKRRENKERTDDSLRKELQLRGEVQQFFQPLDKTMEWVESNYYHLPIAEQVPALIAANAFWKDYADHDPATPFLPATAAEATRNGHEMLMALALLDLPFEAKKHTTKLDGTKLTLTAASPLVIYHEEIQPAGKVAEHAPILVSQNFFRHGDRHRLVAGEQLDKFITEEFLVDVVYGCHLVVTNPTSSRKKVDVLLQIPAGALPVLAGRYTRSVQINLEPYHTQTLEYYFYFPLPGKFAHYPVQVAAGGEVLAYAAPFTFNVVRELTNLDKESWDYISQHGSNDDVLEFLKQQNILQIDLGRIAWRMQDKTFFKTVIDLLAARHVYHHTLWSYGIKHNDVPAIRQFLLFSSEFVAQCGSYLKSPLLDIDPVVRRMYEHMEYRPLVNARVGQLGRHREILNDRLLAQYRRLLAILSYHEKLGDDERMAVTYYLLLQDRVEEALTFFEKVDAARLATRLQYDYFDAYLSFSRATPEEGRQIAQRYADYPVERWRELFLNIINQAQEIEKPEVAVADDEDRTQVQTRAAAASPALEFTVEGRKIMLNYQNLKQVQVNYYLMDVELLFSRNPFVQGDSEQFSNILPNSSATIDLPAAGKVHEFTLPEKLANSNVLIEIVGGGISAAQPYFSGALKVQLMENYGQLRVTHGKADTPLATAYVKVYARLKSGEVRFYKDGYTDLRGRFDYASLSTNELDEVERFSLLIMTDEHGAVIREARAPKQ